MKLIILEKNLNFLEEFFFKIIKKDKDIILDPFNNNLKYLNDNKIKTTNFTGSIPSVIDKNKNIIKKKTIERIRKFSTTFSDEN